MVTIIICPNYLLITQSIRHPLLNSNYDNITLICYWHTVLCSIVERVPNRDIRIRLTETNHEDDHEDNKQKIQIGSKPVRP
ncbi:hypothetical protein B5X24_HaOG206986 [Helicoverpa armigera]|nr:hypothetical protein B5X24_HaOG206986 [Helicoverpa armigera]